MKKIGRLTALALGGGLILLQFANEKGIIYINWDKIEKNIEQKLTITESKSNDIIDWTKSVSISDFLTVFFPILNHLQLKFRSWNPKITSIRILLYQRSVDFS